MTNSYTAPAAPHCHSGGGGRDSLWPPAPGAFDELVRSPGGGGGRYDELLRSPGGEMNSSSAIRSKDAAKSGGSGGNDNLGSPGGSGGNDNRGSPGGSGGNDNRGSSGGG